MSECPRCGREFDCLGLHLAAKEDHRPELSDTQRAIVEFLILRGANIRENAAHSRLEVFSASKEFLADVSQDLGFLANDLRLHESSEEATERLNEQFGGETVTFEKESINDIWAVSTVPHPELGDYREGPESITEMKPTTLRLLVSATGEFEQFSPFPTLHLDVRSFDVSGDHLTSLLRREGISVVEKDSRWENEIGELTHWHDDVVSIPYPDSYKLLKALGLELDDVDDSPITLG